MSLTGEVLLLLHKAEKDIQNGDFEPSEKVFSDLRKEIYGTLVSAALISGLFLLTLHYSVLKTSSTKSLAFWELPLQKSSKSFSGKGIHISSSQFSLSRKLLLIIVLICVQCVLFSLFANQIIIRTSFDLISIPTQNLIKSV
jgi:hypothetical protein